MADELDMVLHTGGISAESLFADEKEAEVEDADGPLPLMNPITGAIVDESSIDSMIGALEEARAYSGRLYAFEQTLRMKLAGMTEGETKTRRVAGAKRTARVEMPDDSWDQPRLKEAWNSYPALRDKYLRLASVSVQIREFKKLRETTTDDPALSQFKAMLVGANLGPTGVPRVTPEK